MIRPARALSTAVLAGVLAVVALVVPDSTVRPTDLTLVDVRRATSATTSSSEGGGRGAVVWILAVGSDARPGDSMTRSRADALQLIGLDPRTGAATAIGIPRDSYVAVPGFGSDKINAAMSLGGPDLLARAVSGLVGVRPDYVFVTRFKAFEQMVDEIGPITVANPRRFSDPNLKDDGFPAGRIRLNGYDAMAFSRIRYGLSGGDFDRSANQQRTLRGIQARLAQQVSRRGFVESGVLSALDNMSTDGVSPAELFRLAHAVAALRPGRMTSCVLRGSVGTVGGASIVRPDVAQARRLGADAQRDATLRSC